MVVLWLHKEDVVHMYEPDQHAKDLYNFIFWLGNEGKRGLLIAGHDKYGYWNPASHQSLLENTRRILLDSIPSHEPDGVGSACKGAIISWKSEGFQITTPNEFRSPIKEMLGLCELEDIGS